MTDGPQPAVRTSFPRNPLRPAVHAGGKSRADAIAEAAARVEELREESLDTIEERMAALEDLLAAGGGAAPSEAEMAELLLRADRLISLAGTFGFDVMVAVLRSLCDLVSHFQKSGSADVEAIRVHVQAARLAAPKSPKLAPAAASQLLEHLGRVRQHFQCPPSAA